MDNFVLIFNFQLQFLICLKKLGFLVTSTISLSFSQHISFPKETLKYILSLQSGTQLVALRSRASLVPRCVFGYNPDHLTGEDPLTHTNYPQLTHDHILTLPSPYNLCPQGLKGHFPSSLSSTKIKHHGKKNVIILNGIFI